MKSYIPSQVLNGTYGEVWLNDEYMAEATSLEAKISLKKTEVNMVGRLNPGQKVTGSENKGTLKMNHVTSNLKKTIAESLKKGKTPSFTLISALSDPDAIGGQTERVKLTGVTFDEVDLINFENGKLGEQSYAFTFDDHEFIDSIDA